MCSIAHSQAIENSTKCVQISYRLVSLTVWYDHHPIPFLITDFSWITLFFVKNL